MGAAFLSSHSSIVNRKSSIDMRVISGRFRGRKLRGPRGGDLRPTGDRLKESLFSILDPSIQGTVFVDVFAGTGAIGIEDLSRGARQVVFVDSSRDACRLIRENLELCGIESDFRLLNSDVFTALRLLEGFSADILFMDPPYQWRPYRDLLEICFRTGLAREDSRVVIEHHRKADVPDGGEDYHRARTVRQGDKCLSFYASGKKATSNPFDRR